MKKKTLFVFLIIAIVFEGIFALYFVASFISLTRSAAFTLEYGKTHVSSDFAEAQTYYALMIIVYLFVLAMCAFILAATSFALKYVKNSEKPAETAEEKRQRKIQAKKEKLQKQLDELEKE